jgi:hypothetical protein
MRTTRLALPLAVLAAGCGGGMSATLNPNPQPTPSSKVSSVVPSCATPVASGASETCTVVVMGTGSFNTAVNWSASSGTISSSGLLTAPTVTAAASITVTATSVQDSVSGTAAVSVTPPAPPPPMITSVTVACPSPIQTGQTSACTANVQGQGSFNPAVTWSASDGTISTSGVLTAPQKVETVIVTATSVQNSKFFGTASVVVQAAPPAVVSVSVSCVTPVNSGATSQCFSTVLPAEAVQTVSWSASNGASITQTGLLTAPTVTTNTNVIVTATSTADATKSGMFTLVVNPPPPPSGPQNLGMGQTPVMLVDSNGVIDYAFGTFTSGAIFRRSTDGGQTFSAPVQIGTGFAQYVAMDIEKGTNAIDLLWWEDAADGAHVDQFFARSTDGMTFTTPLVLHNVQSLLPTFLVDPAGNIEIVWTDFLVGGLYFMVSNDNGKTFSAPTTVVANTGDSLDALAVLGSQGQLYIFYSDENGPACDIKEIFSYNAGGSFSQPVNISNGASKCSVNPAPVVDAMDRVNLAWQASEGAILFSQSLDQGKTFSPPVSVSGPVLPDTVGPKFVVESSGAIDIVWNALTEDFAVFFARSTDSTNFSNRQELGLPQMLNFTGSGSPDVNIDANGHILVAWSDDSNGSYSGDDDIYFRESTDGKTFTSAVNLSNTAATQTVVFPTFAPGTRFLSWEDTEDTQAKSQVLSVFFDAVQ